jgi:hypothetical protein
MAMAPPTGRAAIHLLALTAASNVSQIHQKRLDKFAFEDKATDELMEDSDALGTFVANAFAAEGAHVLDDAVFSGSGVGQPLGLINSPGIITVAKQTGQVAGTVVAANLTDMLGRLLPECLPGAAWLVSPEMFAALYATYKRGFHADDHPSRCGRTLRQAAFAACAASRTGKRDWLRW